MSRGVELLRRLDDQLRNVRSWREARHEQHALCDILRLQDARHMLLTDAHRKTNETHARLRLSHDDRRGGTRGGGGWA